MAALAARLVRNNLFSKGAVFNTGLRAFAERKFTDPLEHATGLEKRELLAHAAGDDDPFDMKALARGPGTKDQPNLIPSAFDARIVGCICEEEAVSINWMWLHKGTPKRCSCGHWFKLVEKKPI